MEGRKGVYTTLRSHCTAKAIIMGMATRVRRSWISDALTGSCVLQLLLVFLQGAFAGSFLSGTDEAVSLHEAGGWIMLAVAILQVALIVVGRLSYLGIWFLLSSSTILVAELLQVGTGYGHYMQVHIPLALVVVGILVWQLIWIQTRTKANTLARSA